MQCVNSLAVVIAIQRKHDIMRDKRYLMTIYNAVIVYFKALTKHLNAGKKIDIAEMTLLNSYFNEWCKNIKNMLFIQKSFIL